MQVQSVSFQGSRPKHGARVFGEVMNNLYKTARYNGFHDSGLIQISVQMQNGKTINGVANFCNGQYIGLSLPKNFEKYRKEFCKTVFNKFNENVTKGKCNRKYKMPF